MEQNAFFPTRHISHDPANIRDRTQAAENLCDAQIEAPDDVFGASAKGLPASRFEAESWAADFMAWRRLRAGIVMLHPTYDLPDIDPRIDVQPRFKAIANG